MSRMSRLQTCFLFRHPFFSFVKKLCRAKTRMPTMAAAEEETKKEREETTTFSTFTTNNSIQIQGPIIRKKRDKKYQSCLLMNKNDDNGDNDRRFCTGGWILAIYDTSVAPKSSSVFVSTEVIRSSMKHTFYSNDKDETTKAKNENENTKRKNANNDDKLFNEFAMSILFLQNIVSIQATSTMSSSSSSSLNSNMSDSNDNKNDDDNNADEKDDKNKNKQIPTNKKVSYEATSIQLVKCSPNPQAIKAVWNGTVQHQWYPPNVLLLFPPSSSFPPSKSSSSENLSKNTNEYDVVKDKQENDKVIEEEGTSISLTTVPAIAQYFKTEKQRTTFLLHRLLTSESSSSASPSSAPTDVKVDGMSTMAAATSRSNSRDGTTNDPLVIQHKYDLRRLIGRRPRKRQPHKKGFDMQVLSDMEQMGQSGSDGWQLLSPKIAKSSNENESNNDQHQHQHQHQSNIVPFTSLHDQTTSSMINRDTDNDDIVQSSKINNDANNTNYTTNVNINNNNDNNNGTDNDDKSILLNRQNFQYTASNQQPKQNTKIDQQISQDKNVHNGIIDFDNDYKNIHDTNDTVVNDDDDDDDNHNNENSEYINANNQHRRLEYLKRKKKPQIQWMVQRIQQLERDLDKKGDKENDNNDKNSNTAIDDGNNIKRKRFQHIVDVGGGRGDLAIAGLAVHFPTAHITMIDLNGPSLEAAKLHAQQVLSSSSSSSSNLSSNQGEEDSTNSNHLKDDKINLDNDKSCHQNENDLSRLHFIQADFWNVFQNPQDFGLIPPSPVEELVPKSTGGEQTRTRTKIPSDANRSSSTTASGTTSNTASIPKVDLVVALHACGDLSDLVIDFAHKVSCPFVVCPCCYTKRYISRNYNFIPPWTTNNTIGNYTLPTLENKEMNKFTKEQQQQQQEEEGRGQSSTPKHIAATGSTVTVAASEVAVAAATAATTATTVLGRLAELSEKPGISRRAMAVINSMRIAGYCVKVNESATPVYGRSAASSSTASLAETATVGTRSKRYSLEEYDGSTSGRNQVLIGIPPSETDSE